MLRARGALQLLLLLGRVTAVLASILYSRGESFTECAPRESDLRTTRPSHTRTSRSRPSRPSLQQQHAHYTQASQERLKREGSGEAGTLNYTSHDSLPYRTVSLPRENKPVPQIPDLTVKTRPVPIETRTWTEGPKTASRRNVRTDANFSKPTIQRHSPKLGRALLDAIWISIQGVVLVFGMTCQD